jgi:hypothetical protein
LLFTGLAGGVTLVVNMPAISTIRPGLDDTAQRLLWKIATYLWTATGLSTAESGIGSPVGVVTPTAKGQFYYDTNSGRFWVATGLTSAAWTLA